MEFSAIALIELGVVMAFVLGWGILELVGLRLDKQKREREAREKAAAEGDAPGPGADGSSP